MQNDTPANPFIHDAIFESKVPRPEAISKALKKSAMPRLICLLNASQQLTTNTELSYTQPRKNVAYSIMTAWIGNEDFNVKQCADEKMINRENVYKILADYKVEGWITKDNKPTDKMVEMFFEKMKDLMDSDECKSFVACITCSDLMSTITQDDWD